LVNKHGKNTNKFFSVFDEKKKFPAAGFYLFPAGIPG